MPRLFAGHEIPPHVSSVLESLQDGLFDARWIDPADFHVTLRFIGDVSIHVANDIDSLLADVDRKPLTLRLSSVGVFGGDKPHSIYAEVEPSRELSALQSEVERIVQACGVGLDKRKFHPHVTLARLKNISPFDVAQYLSQNGYFPPQSVAVSRFALFSSRASTGGGPYKLETSYPLRRVA
jgi:RNA 2',3'-cyclic 3'-phosphodiesterase